MLDYQELVNVMQKGERAVLATVISSRGSAPRKAGVKMLVRKDSTFVGTRGGGSVEQQVQGRRFGW